MSRKAFAPKIASPDTLYSSMRLSWSVLVVVSSMATSRLCVTMCGAGRTAAWHVDSSLAILNGTAVEPLGGTRPAVWPVLGSELLPAPRTDSPSMSTDRDEAEVGQAAAPSALAPTGGGLAI